MDDQGCKDIGDSHVEEAEPLPPFQVLMALVIFRVHHRDNPSDLLKQGWKRGPLPLSEPPPPEDTEDTEDTEESDSSGKPSGQHPVPNGLANSSAWFSASPQHPWRAFLQPREFINGVRRQRFYGYFAELALSEQASPSDNQPTVLHWPTIRTTDSLLGQAHPSELRCELIPLSSTASLGNHPRGEYERDAFLCVWITTSCTEKQAKSLVKDLGKRLPGSDVTGTTLSEEYNADPEPIVISRDRDSGVALLKLLGALPAYSFSHHLQDQIPFVAATMFGGPPESRQVRGLSRRSLLTYPKPILGQDFEGNRIYGWLTKNSTIELRVVNSASLTNAYRMFIIDTCIALKVAAIQAAQVEAFVDRMQEVSTDPSQASQQVLDLYNRYQVFKRRHVWTRLARRSVSNHLLRELTGTWGVDRIVMGMDTEFRDYAQSAQLRVEEQQRRDEMRWQGIAKIGSVAVVAVALLGTWATIAALRSDENDWITRGSVIWLIAAVSVGIGAGGLWATVSNQRESSSRWVLGTASSISLAWALISWLAYSSPSTSFAIYLACSLTILLVSGTLLFLGFSNGKSPK